MKQLRQFGVWTAVGISSFLLWNAHAGQPSSLPVPSLSPSPLVVPSSVPLSDGDSARLLKEFKKSLATELQALEHRQKLELVDLKASQVARHKEWEKKEQESRHKFFESHPKGVDTRAYVKNFVNRRKAVLQIQADEILQRKHQNEVRFKSIKEDHIVRLKEFQEYLNRRERPPVRLWPEAGR